MAQNGAKSEETRKKGKKKPIEAEKGRGHIVCITRDIEQSRRRPRQERHPFANLSIKRGKRFARVYFHLFHDTTVLNQSTACTELVCRCVDHVRTVYTISIQY